jgi:putative transposase
MRIISGTAPGALHLAGRSQELSPAARRRLKWMDYYEQHGRNARLTCRHFDISPQTFYRWRRRYHPQRLQSLEERSRRPRQVRRPTWSGELAQAVCELREQYPRWGKDKLAPLLREAGWPVSTSMVGRILRHLKQQGVLVEPLLSAVAVRRSSPPRPYAVRKPRAYLAKLPGDIVQVDTLDLRPLPGMVLKHFTARDVVSRWDVLEVHTRATAQATAGFLNAIQARMPFPVRAIQVDGGSEFQAEFEQECQRRQIHLFVLPPRSPKLNGSVERAQRTHTEEFYEVWDLDWTVPELNRQLRAWEEVYNTVRPHQSLGYRTPQRFLHELAPAST